jgi:hypothetical protein
MVPALIFLAAALAATDASPPVLVRGDTECPSPGELRAALLGLVSSVPTSTPPDIAELHGQGGSMTVRLLNAQGDAIAEKVLPAHASCGERARTAAVIVAAWEAHLRAGLQGDLSVPAPAPPPPAPPPPMTPPVAAPPARADLASERAVTVVRAGPPPTTTPLEVEAGAAIVASVVSGQVAPAALVEVVGSRHGGRFAVGLGALAVDTHTAALDAGAGAWRRLGATLDARVRSRWGRLELEVRAGGALTALAVEGRDLPRASGTTLVDPGAFVGARGQVHLGAFAPWIEGTAVLWPGAHTLYVAGTPNAVDVPAAEALLGLGVSFDAGR